MKFKTPYIYIVSILLFTQSCGKTSRLLDIQSEELIGKYGVLEDISRYKSVEEIGNGEYLHCIPITSVENFDNTSLKKINLSESNLVSNLNNCQCIEGLNYLISGPKVQEVILLRSSIRHPDCIKITHPIYKIDLGINFIKDWEVPLNWINKGLVKNISLSTNRIELIPDQFNTNTTLTHLNFSENKIQVIPSSIKNLTTLKELNLRGNLIDSLPEELAELKSLKRIILDKNRFEKFPEVLLRMPHLEYIQIDKNYYPIINDSIRIEIKKKLPDTEIFY